MNRGSGVVQNHRRIAQRQSASKHTEEAAAFNSCSAYQAQADLLFLSHCVPNPPDKGEKIRAFHILQRLAQRYRVHLVCFARSKEEARHAFELREQCASVYAEVLSPNVALCRGLPRFALGRSLNEAYYSSRRMREHIGKLGAADRIGAAFVYTAVMAPYVPAGLPFVLDLVDVDSEKWLQYGQERRPGFLYRLEAARLRRFEIKCMQRAAFTYVTTANELSVLRGFAAGAAAGYIENGVDTDFFDGSPQPASEWERRRFVAFIGAMDYHPNIEGARWFASEVFPLFRRRVPDLEFLIVGRNPAKPVRELAAAQGVHVLGGVPDVRPFLAAARAIAAPLRLARGIQNKVLEALAMGREVFASPEVCRTFGGSVPTGVVECRSAEDYIRRIEFASAREPACTAAIRSGVRERFDWETNLAPLCSKLESLLSQTAIGVRV